jgi:cyclopropane-fatty-acyl-phospholipid synthase
VSAPPATNQHYDLDPRIFALFLDPTRKYSAGLYRDDADDLATAQRRKLAFVTGRLAVHGGGRVLDVGCGWGAVTLHLAGEHGCRVTGVTPAARQRDHVLTTAADQGLGGLVEVHHGTIEEFTAPRASFDAAAALGSVVHVPDLPGVLARVRRLLRRGARCYVSESCFRNADIAAAFDDRPATEFVRHEIFGNGRLRPLSELVAAAETAGFSVEAVDDLTDDYRRTIEDWIAGIAAHADRIDALSPGTSARLTEYLHVANAGWGYTTKHYGLTLRNAR